MKKDLLQKPDKSTLTGAKKLIRTSRHGVLSVVDQGSGSPISSLIGLATDSDGSPIFPASALGRIIKAMQSHPRVSLLVENVGRGDPLAHPRISLTAFASKLEGEDRQRARRRYLARHTKASIYIDFKDFSIWKLSIQSALYIAGFGQAYELAQEHLSTTFDDWSAWHSMEAGAVEHMNEDHADAIELYATVFCKAAPGKWRLTGLDPEGLDLALGDDHRRLNYDRKLSTVKELRPRLIELVKQAREDRS